MFSAVVNTVTSLQFGPRDQRAGHRGGGRAHVEQDGLAAGDLARGVGADVGLLGGRGLAPRPRMAAPPGTTLERHRAAADASELAARLERLEVAADRDRGDLEAGGEVDHAHEAALRAPVRRSAPGAARPGRPRRRAAGSVVMSAETTGGCGGFRALSRRAVQLPTETAKMCIAGLYPATSPSGGRATAWTVLLGSIDTDCSNTYTVWPEEPGRIVGVVDRGHLDVGRVSVLARRVPEVADVRAGRSSWCRRCSTRSRPRSAASCSSRSGSRASSPSPRRR